MANTDTEIKGKITVDTSAAAKQLSDLNKIITEQKKIWKDSKEGSEEYLSAQKKLAEATSQHNELQRKVNEANGKSAESFDILKSKIQGVVPGLSGAESGVKSFGAELKVLAMNPVMLILTAIVGVLALMYAAFKNTFEGGEKMEQIFNGIKSAGQALFDNLDKIGKAIVKVFSFDFSGAKKEIMGVVDAASEAYSKTAALTKQAQALHVMQNENDLDQARRQAKLADLKEKQQDKDNYSAAERKKAGEELLAESRKNAEEDMKLNASVANNKIQMLLVQKEGALKNRDEINKIRIEEINNQRENSNELRAIQKQNNAVAKEIAADEKQRASDRAAMSKKAIADQKEAEQALKQKLENETKLFVEGIKKKKAQEDLFENMGKELEKDEELKKKQKDAQEKLGLDNKAAYEKQKAHESIVTEKERSDAIIAIATAEAEGRIAMAQAISGTLSGLADVVGRQTAVGKGLAVASALINTYQGIAAGVKLGYPLAIPAVIMAGVTGFGAVRNILKTKVPGVGDSVSASAPLSVAAPILPTQQSTKIDAQSTQAIGNAASGGVGRVFLLDADINNNAERNARIARAARL